jgi:multidrug efflux pump subunit AcrA (membrane-fusion protein)
MENANGTQLIIMNKKLWFDYTPPKGGQWGQPIDGYIDPSDEPSSQVVNVDESALNAVKQSVATAQSTANNADNKAMRALISADNAQKSADTAKAQIAALQAQVSALQAQVNNLLTPQQVADLVWTKVWDSNYQIRMGFLAGKSPIQEVQDYLNDLRVYIKNVMSGK